MKTVVTGRKGQYFTLPLILLFTILLFLFYLVMVYPSERAKILGYDEEDVGSIFGDSVDIIFSSGEVFEVGRSAGQRVFNFTFGSVESSNLVKSDIIESMSPSQMRANVFVSDSKEFAINGLNLNKTEDVLITLNVGESRGAPRLTLYLNKTVVFEKMVQPDNEYKVRVSKTLLEKDNIFTVKVAHTGGAFWEAHTIFFNGITFTNDYYDQSIKSIKDLNLGENTFLGDAVHIYFDTIDANNAGELNILIKKPGAKSAKEVWSGTPLIGEKVDALIDYNAIGLGINEIIFETGKGGSYDLENTKIAFVAEPSPATKKIYSFDIPTEELSSNKEIVFGLKINRVIEPGQIGVRLLPSSLIQNFDSATLASGGWTYLTLNKFALKELGNKIEVDSTNGKFKIDGAVVLSKDKFNRTAAFPNER